MINEALKTYLKERHKTKELWVKCYFKASFTCGMCTSSRIEAKHKIYKKYLNGDSRLCEVFHVFKLLEEIEIFKYQDEISKFNLLENKKAKQHELFQEAEKIYGAYVLEKLKEVFLDSTNYEVELKNKIW